MVTDVNKGSFFKKLKKTSAVKRLTDSNPDGSNIKPAVASLAQIRINRAKIDAPAKPTKKENAGSTRLPRQSKSVPSYAEKNLKKKSFGEPFGAKNKLSAAPAGETTMTETFDEW